jgi:polyisoprenoid-binding protein YceI
VTNHPLITFEGSDVEVLSGHEFVVTGDLTIRGVSKRVPLKVTYLGQWPTPWWEDGEDKGPKMRASFLAVASIDRREFGISWNGDLERGGSVVGNTVQITIDAEAIQEG